MEVKKGFFKDNISLLVISGLFVTIRRIFDITSLEDDLSTVIHIIRVLDPDQGFFFFFFTGRTRSEYPESKSC